MKIKLFEDLKSTFEGYCVANQTPVSFDVQQVERHHESDTRLTKLFYYIQLGVHMNCRKGEEETPKTKIHAIEMLNHHLYGDVMRELQEIEMLYASEHGFGKSETLQKISELKSALEKQSEAQPIF